MSCSARTLDAESFQCTKVACGAHLARVSAEQTACPVQDRVTTLNWVLLAAARGFCASRSREDCEVSRLFVPLFPGLLDMVRPNYLELCLVVL